MGAQGKSPWLPGLFQNWNNGWYIKRRDGSEDCGLMNWKIPFEFKLQWRVAGGMVDELLACFAGKPCEDLNQRTGCRQRIKKSQ